VRKALKATQGTVVLSSEAEDTGVLDEVINHKWGWGKNWMGRWKNCGRHPTTGRRFEGMILGMGELGDSAKPKEAQAARSGHCHTGTVSLQAAQAVIPPAVRSR
jgi:hypothetical protein